MKIKKGFAKRKIGNRYIVVATGELSKSMNIFIEMNDTSNDIWDCVAKGLSANETANFLCEKYNISYEKAKSDTETMIAQMRDAGVLEEE